MVRKHKCGDELLRFTLPVSHHSARETEVWPEAECMALTRCLLHFVILGILWCLGMVLSTSRICKTHRTRDTAYEVGQSQSWAPSPGH